MFIMCVNLENQMVEQQYTGTGHVSGMSRNHVEDKTKELFNPQLFQWGRNTLKMYAFCYNKMQ